MNRAIYNIKSVRWLLGYDENYNVLVIPTIRNKDDSKFKNLITGQVYELKNKSGFGSQEMQVLGIKSICNNFIRMIDKKLYIINFDRFLLLDKKIICRFKTDNQLLTQNQVKTLAEKIEKIAINYTKKDLEKEKAQNLKNAEISKIEDDTFNF